MLTSTANKTCQSCAYWKTNGTDGECRRHAPQSIIFKVDGNVKYDAQFPVTKSADWCGEYDAK